MLPVRLHHPGQQSMSRLAHPYTRIADMFHSPGLEQGLMAHFTSSPAYPNTCMLEDLMAAT